MQPTGRVIYQGPSMLDGAPIVAIAITHSTNAKTGDMVQTYILRSDVKPTDAVKSGADASICGNCKHRPFNGGACYVTVFQGPLSVFGAFKRGRYPAASARELPALGNGRMVRLGTYGDPAAVPAKVWQALTRDAMGRTGYSHQWGNEALSAAHRKAIAALTMASVDSMAEAVIAKASGLRYFRIRTAAEPVAKGEFICPASAEAGKRKTCAECGACSWHGACRSGKRCDHRSRR